MYDAFFAHFNDAYNRHRPLTATGAGSAVSASPARRSRQRRERPRTRWNHGCDADHRGERAGRVADAAAPRQALVVGDRIERIAETIDTPPGAKVVDLPGHTVTPGFVDCHAHVALARTSAN